MGIRSWLVGVAASGAVVAGAAAAGTGAFDDDTERGPDAEIIDAGGLGAFKIRVGDCVNWPKPVTDPETDLELITSVEGVRCAAAHDGQAYGKFDVADAENYDQTAVSNAATQGCLARWTDAIGTTFVDDMAHDVRFLEPTKASWQELGDREVICFVVSLDGSPLVGSRLENDANGSS